VHINENLKDCVSHLERMENKLDSLLFHLFFAHLGMLAIVKIWDTARPSLSHLVK
jgi:hypothetical protein